MMNLKQTILILLLGGFMLLAGCQLVQPTRSVDPPVSDNGAYTPDEALKLVTLLPKDAIPSIDNPTFYSAAEADAEYEDDELVLGVAFDGDARAYSTALLSRHEIVNDVVNGRPIAVTW